MPAFEYGSAIKVTFDMPIITTLPVTTGSEEYRPIGGSASALISSSDYSTNPKGNAFDELATTYWRANATTAGQWLGKDFGRAVTLTKLGVQMDYASGRINAYKIQGSADGTTWVDVATGNFTNASGMQYATFTAAAYRYWRVYAESKFSSYYTITELAFIGARPVYDVAGWTVTGIEPAMSPEGAPVATTYAIRKITKADDDYAVILWLDLDGRMKHPQGLVTVAFTGTLAGPGNAMVVPFTLTFTPANIAPVFHPNDAEQISLDLTTTTLLKRIYFEYYQAGIENISITPTITTALIHINDLET